MPEKLLGKPASKSINAKTKEMVEEFVAASGRSPVLVVVQVGDDPASNKYIAQKEKAAAKLGIESRLVRLSAEVSQDQLNTTLSNLSSDTSVDGIILQLPLPAHLNVDVAVRHIAPQKDVDGFHPENLGWLVRGNPKLVPCTPAGVISLLEHYSIELEGLDAVVVGRSIIVGKPMALLLLQKNCTVTVCHSRTKELASKVKSADLVVAAVGKPYFIKPDWVKENAILVDVGINVTPEGKLAGDIHPEAYLRSAFYTPVPGGVGPMTVAMLMYNTALAALSRINR